MKIVNPVLFVLMCIVTILNLVDYFTAIGGLVAEANPIYVFTGNYFLVFIIKIIMLILGWLLCFDNTFKNEFYLYNFVFLLVIIIFILSICIYSNISVKQELQENPELIELQKNIPKEQKVQDYFHMITLVYFIPYIFSILIFSLFLGARKYIKFGNTTIKDFYNKLKDKK